MVIAPALEHERALVIARRREGVIVHLQHRAFSGAGEFFTALERHCQAGDTHFVDGTIFAPDRLFLTLGRFAHKAPSTSDYTFEHIYYRSIAAKREDWLTIRDYLWR